MRLHRLTLRDVKGVRERIVDLPDRGVVVLEGPNEVGKSTMLEAFDALLSFKATSRAAEVRALQPVDRDVAPFVEAELTVGGTRVRYAKRWLRQPATTLHVLGARPEQLTGDAAQSRMDTLLRDNLDRTLYDALRLSQSGDGTVAPLASSTVLTEALDAAAGGQLHAEGADALLDQVESEYRRYFTATGRPTGDYKLAMARFTQAQQDVADAHLRLEEGRRLLERRTAARERVAAGESACSLAVRELGRAEEVAAAAEVVAEAHRAAAQRHAQALELQHAAARAQEQRRRLLGRLESLRASLGRAGAAQQEDLARAETLAAGLRDAETAAAAAAAAAEQAADRLETARDRLDHLSRARELASLEATLARATELVERVRATAASVPATQVSREEARDVRTLQDRLDAAVARHEMLSPKLEVESLGAEVEVITEAGAGTTFRPGASGQVSVEQETTLEVPGQVRVRVRLQEDGLGRADEIGRLREELAEALAALGAGGVDEVEELAARTEEARAAVREAARDVEALLRPLGRGLAAEAAAGVLPHALTRRVEEARARFREGPSHDEEPPHDGPSPSDEEAARTAIERATADLRAARAEQRGAAEALQLARAETATVTARLERAAGAIEADTVRLSEVEDEVLSARADVADDALATVLAGRSADVEAATVAVEEAAAAVDAADVDGARAAVRRARERHRRATAEREAALAELHAVGGQLEMAAGEGRQELYDLAVADLDAAERELQAVDRCARAARHLRTTLTEHRDAAHRTYVEPYTRALEDLGRRVFGPSFSVTVGDDLGLAARTLDGVTVPYDELSGGAKEQLGILARLAVARLVDPERGVPVVIDDALGYSDPDRLRQMGEVLGTTVGDGDEVQVILLTCTPDRYAVIPHASTVRLTA